MIDTTSIDHILMAAEAARSRGDYDEYWRLRREYLLAQSRLYEQQQRLREAQQRLREAQRVR